MIDTQNEPLLALAGLLSLFLLASRPAHLHNAVECSGCGRAWASILGISDRTRHCVQSPAANQMQCKCAYVLKRTSVRSLRTRYAARVPSKANRIFCANLFAAAAATNVTLREPEERFRVGVSRSIQLGEQVREHCSCHGAALRGGSGERPGSFSRKRFIRRSGEAPLQSADLQPTRPLRVLRLNGRVHAGMDAGSESGQVCTGIETDSSRMREPVRPFAIMSEDRRGVRAWPHTRGWPRCKHVQDRRLLR